MQIITIDIFTFIKTHLTNLFITPTSSEFYLNFCFLLTFD